MDADPGTQNSIVFLVPRSATTRVRQWQQEANLCLIAGELETRGEARVILHTGERRFSTITHLPALGDAEPLIRDFGGLYTFIFNPEGDGCSLQVSAPPHTFTRLGAEPALPLNVYIPGPVIRTKRDSMRHGLDWSSPSLATDTGRFIHEVSLDELEFPIDGTMYKRLVAWGWDPLQVEAYSYIFVPLSVGCEMAVEHQPSGQQIHLTEGVGW